jgi:hypothetical protein
MPYAHSERGALVCTASNFTRTRFEPLFYARPGFQEFQRVTIAPSSVASQEVDHLIPSRALDNITDLPNIGFEQRWSFGNCGGARLFGRYR